MSGIFVDETSANAGNVSYYCDIYNYIKANRSSLTVVLNAGTATPESYVTCSDTLILFENDGSQWASFEPPTYVSLFVHFLH